MLIAVSSRLKLFLNRKFRSVSLALFRCNINWWLVFVSIGDCSLSHTITITLTFMVCEFVCQKTQHKARPLTHKCYHSLSTMVILTMEDTKECSPFIVFYGYNSIFSPPSDIIRKLSQWNRYAIEWNWTKESGSNMFPCYNFYNILLIAHFVKKFACYACKRYFFGWQDWDGKLSNWHLHFCKRKRASSFKRFRWKYHSMVNKQIFQLI